MTKKVYNSKGVARGVTLDRTHHKPKGLGASCAKNKHSQCSMLNCTCRCHGAYK